MVVFDFETTGLDPSYDKIIEIGAIKICGDKTLAEFESLVRTESPISSVVERITGINDQMLENQPKIEELLPRFLEFIKGSIIVAHNAAFDVAFLKAEAFRQGIELDWSAFCTLKLARNLLQSLIQKV